MPEPEAVQLLYTCLWHMSGDHGLTEVLLETKYSHIYLLCSYYVHAATYITSRSLRALCVSKIGKNIVHLDATWSHNIFVVKS